jgi:hypothetical protein
MDTGFDQRRLALNHVLYGLWTALLLSGTNPLAVLDGGGGAAIAIVGLWAVAGVALLATDCLVAYRVLATR